MPNAEHLRIALQGAQALNLWRSEHPEEPLDLSGANLRRVELAHANLAGADMSKANLEWADLRWADLVNAILTEANLTRADLHKGDLQRATLRDAILLHANLEDANLSGARLNRSRFGHTRLINTDLSAAIGLKETLHDASSELDRETLTKSADLPVVFLRGCGLYTAYRALVFRVVIGSPSDVKAERELARNVIYSWNDRNAHHYGAILLPVLWETHSTPELEDRAQAIIDRQLIETSQILVCIFWSRLGTETGEAESGTVEEILKFTEAGKPVLVYFSSQPIPQTFDPDQWSRLQAFKSRIMARGLIGSFESEQELSKKLQDHLTEVLRELLVARKAS